MDVSSAAIERLNGIAGGYRHCSGDEHYLAEVQAGFGKIRLFDMTSPRNLKLLTQYHDSGAIIAAAAINDDGSLLAAVLTRPIRAGNDRRSDDVVVFDRDLKIVAKAARSLQSTYGITLVKNTLLVGFQLGGLPKMPVPSQQVDLYDLRPLR